MRLAVLVTACWVSACAQEAKQEPPHGGPPEAAQTGTGAQPAAGTAPSPTAGPPSASVASKGQGALLVAMGGWNSCSDDLSTLSPLQSVVKGTVQVMAERAWQQDVTLFSTCFTGDATQLRFERSDRPGAVTTVDFATFQAAIYEFIRTENVSAHVLAHSYGAYYAMKVVAEAPAPSPILQLLTFDPISPVTCTPDMVVQRVLGKVLTNQAEGCTRFPPDIGTAEQAKIRAKLKSWDNFYVRDLFGILHSSTAEAATNHQVQVPFDALLRAHVHIFSRFEMYDIVEKIVVTSRS